MSRTQWGECEDGVYTVRWQPDDRIRVMLSSADNIGTGSIEHISANGLGACFAVDMSLACEPSEYICYACCPESACKDMTPAEDDSQGHVSLAFTVPTRQMPSDKSFDPDAAVIFGRSTAADRMPQVFDMRFTSVVAYGKLTIMDLPKEPDERGCFGHTACFAAAYRPSRISFGQRDDVCLRRSRCVERSGNRIRLDRR